MGLFDFVGLGIAAAEDRGVDSDATKNFDATFPGSFAITVGDSLSSFIGSGRHTHIYGDEFKFVCDWEAIEDKILHALPLKARAVLLGLGGNATLVFGNDAALKYGETVAVKRAHTTDITGGPNFLARLLSGEGVDAIKPNPAAAAGTQQEQEKADQSAGFGAGVCCSLMVLSSLAVELAVKIMFPTPPKTGPTALQTLLREADWTVSSRLAAYAFALEQTGYQTRKGLTSLELVKVDLEAAKALTQTASTTAADALSTYKTQVNTRFTGAEQRLTAAEGRIDNGVTETAAAAAAAKRALQQIASLTGAVGDKVEADDSGNILLKSINSLSARALKDFRASGGNNVWVRAMGNGVAPNTGKVRIDGATAVTASAGVGGAYMSLDAMENANAAVLGAQGATGSAAVFAGSDETGGRMFLDDSGAVLRVGANVDGPRVVLTEGQLELSVGPPGVGASIVLTNASITIKIAEVSYQMTPVGTKETVAEVNREVSPAGHLITAAETSENVGVAGITHNTPINTSEDEATTSVSDAVDEHSTEGPKTVVGAIVSIN